MFAFMFAVIELWLVWIRKEPMKGYGSLILILCLLLMFVEV